MLQEHSDAVADTGWEKEKPYCGILLFLLQLYCLLMSIPIIKAAPSS